MVKESSKESEESSNSSEMATTSLLSEDETLASRGGGNLVTEQETNVDGVQSQGAEDDETSTLMEISSASDLASNKTGRASRTNLHSTSTASFGKRLPSGWEQHSDKSGPYYWHVATGIIQRNRPTEGTRVAKESLELYHDDEEINQASVNLKTSSDDETEYFESGAALTLADDPTQTYSNTAFVVYPLGCCEFDETQLVAATNTKAIQKCILKLLNKPTSDEESVCWGLSQSQPILMRLLEDHIQFTDIKSQSLLRSQPVSTIKTWAVDDDNNFAFVVEDRNFRSSSPDYFDSVDDALMNEPMFVCYVFSSMDDDNMSSKVAAKLNEQINRYKEHMSNRITKSARLQQMVERPAVNGEDQTDVDEDLEEFEESNERSMDVKYIGRVQVPRPVGIDVLNVAIDKCLANASRAHMNRLAAAASCNHDDPLDGQDESPLLSAQIHVSPSSVIIENVVTGDIIVECRIRYLTFMGISRRDIRWCGFIMQNTTNKSFEAHCFECHPTAGHVCEAIQASCSKMYEKVVRSQSRQPADATSIIPKSSRIRDTLAKTLSRIKLSPIS